MAQAIPPYADTLEPLNGRKTLVEQVVDRIVEAAARGIFLPGDRVVEAEVARRLQVSRVPVREALRLLESQGIVENMPYRGMRLMDVSVARLEKVLKVRLVLEQLAAEEAGTGRRRRTRRSSAPLARHARSDGTGAASEATVSSSRGSTRRSIGSLCGLTGNDVLLRTWEPLSLQLTIIFGLSAMQKDLVPIAAEHTEIIEVLRSQDAASVADAHARPHRRLHARPRPRGVHQPPEGRRRGRLTPDLPVSGRARASLPRRGASRAQASRRAGQSAPDGRRRGQRVVVGRLVEQVHQLPVQAAASTAACGASMQVALFERVGIRGRRGATACAPVAVAERHVFMGAVRAPRHVRSK